MQLTFYTILHSKYCPRGSIQSTKSACLREFLIKTISGSVKTLFDQWSVLRKRLVKNVRKTNKLWESYENLWQWKDTLQYWANCIRVQWWFSILFADFGKWVLITSYNPINTKLPLHCPVGKAAITCCTSSDNQELCRTMATGGILVLKILASKDCKSPSSQ